MVQDGRLDVPVVGVARSEWDRRRSSGTGPGSRSRSGSTGTTRRCSTGCWPCCATSRASTPGRPPTSAWPTCWRAVSGRCTTWPSPRRLFDDVVQGLAGAGLASGARVVVEKPFGRDVASAAELDQVLHQVFPEDVHLPDRPLPGQGGGREHARLPLRQLAAGAGVEPQLRQPGPDHHGRGVRGRRPRRVLRERRGHPRRVPEPRAAGRGPVGHGGPRRGLGRRAAGREGEGVPPDLRHRSGRHAARPVRGLPRGGGGRARLRRRDLRRAAVHHRVVAVVGGAVGDPVRQGAGRDTPPRRSSSSPSRPGCCSWTRRAPIPAPTGCASCSAVAGTASSCRCTPRRRAMRWSADWSTSRSITRRRSASGTRPISGSWRTPWRATPVDSVARTVWPSSGASWRPLLEDPDPVALYEPGTWGPESAARVPGDVGLHWIEPLPVD